jgi:glycine hydroxymethyltransferase
VSKKLLQEFTRRGVDLLSEHDPVLYELLDQEYRRQNDTLAMIAASSIADPSVIACEGMVTSNVTTEGYAGARYHAGCRFVDEIERLAIERAKAAFKARYANVQPHSGSTANQVVMFNLLKAGDTVLRLDLDAGGHLTHGDKASVSGRYFNAVGYGLDGKGLIDYAQVYELALRFKPKLIICGASAYPRVIDFKRFREIADEAGAFLMADISHIAGLVVAGEHPSPIDHAHFTTTSTYKQLYGPRGGLILIGKDYEQPSPDGCGTLSSMVQRGVFPFFQGTPNLSVVAAKARALAFVATAEFRELARLIVSGARALAEWFVAAGYKVLTGGSDNHIVLIDVQTRGMTGLVAERALEECGIIVNKNKIPGDKRSALITGGLRLGTNCLAARGMGAAEMPRCAGLINQVLSSMKVLGESSYELDEGVTRLVRAEVRQLCAEFPIPRYPISALGGRGQSETFEAVPRSQRLPG